MFVMPLLRVFLNILFILATVLEEKLKSRPVRKKWTHLCSLASISLSSDVYPSSGRYCFSHPQQIMKPIIAAPYSFIIFGMFNP
jgi:hypothetical protein